MGVEVGGFFGGLLLRKYRILRSKLRSFFHCGFRGGVGLLETGVRNCLVSDGLTICEFYVFTSVGLAYGLLICGASGLIIDDLIIFYVCVYFVHDFLSSNKKPRLLA
jgi:hypothetical protein